MKEKLIFVVNPDELNPSLSNELFWISEQVYKLSTEDPENPELYITKHRSDKKAVKTYGYKPEQLINFIMPAVNDH